jgi:hypothetical protein
MPKNELDWQRIETSSEAIERARELLQPGETFTVEPFSDHCPMRERTRTIPQ